MLMAVQMPIRLSLLVLLLACTDYAPVVLGMERVGDATYLYELERYANAVTGLDTEFLSLIEAAPSEQRFCLYWTYNHMTGSWSKSNTCKRCWSFRWRLNRTRMRNQSEQPFEIKLNLCIGNSATPSTISSRTCLRSGQLATGGSTRRSVRCSPESERPSIVCGPINVRICHVLPPPDPSLERTGRYAASLLSTSARPAGQCKSIGAGDGNSKRSWWRQSGGRSGSRTGLALCGRGRHRPRLSAWSACSRRIVARCDLVCGPLVSRRCSLAFAYVAPARFAVAW